VAGSSAFYGEGFILKGFPSILHFVPRHRRGVEGRSSGSKDTLKGTKGGEVFKKKTLSLLVTDASSVLPRLWRGIRMNPLP